MRRRRTRCRLLRLCVHQILKSMMIMTRIAMTVTRPAMLRAQSQLHLPLLPAGQVIVVPCWTVHLPLSLRQSTPPYGRI